MFINILFIMYFCFISFIACFAVIGVCKIGIASASLFIMSPINDTRVIHLITLLPSSTSIGIRQLVSNAGLSSTVPEVTELLQPGSRRNYIFQQAMGELALKRAPVRLTSAECHKKLYKAPFTAKPEG